MHTLLLLLLPLFAPTIKAGCVVSTSTSSVKVCAEPTPSSTNPHVGDVATLTLTLASQTANLTATSATVNGVDVAASLLDAGGGVYTLAYTTPAGDEAWPWAGLLVEATLEGSSGLPVVISGTVVPGSTWSEESALRGFSLSRAVRGLCMGDVDSDGDVDVFAPALAGSHHQLWVNDGGGGFMDVGPVGNQTDDGIGCGFADADNDGDLDLIVTTFQAARQSRLYMNSGEEGAPVFVEEATPRGVTLTGETTSASWGDVDGDGLLDLFLVGTLSALYVNSGAGVFTDVSASSGVGLVTTDALARQVVLGDLTADGHIDALVVSASGSVFIFVNDGAGSFTEASTTLGVSSAAPWRGCCIGDVDGDGQIDIYITSWDAADVLYTNTGAGFQHSASLAADPDTPSFGVSFLDVEHDGDVDVYVGALATPDVAWLNSGSSFFDAFPSLFTTPDSTTTAVVAGDIDGDGDVDIMTSHSSDVLVNHNSRPGRPSSVRVRPLTAAGAQSAFGAVVRLACVAACEQTYTGMRVVDGGSGYFSQNGYDAHFGVREVLGRYNGSVSWAGGVHPVATWASHPLLGGVVPGEAPLAPLLVVRPEAVRLHVTVPPWDFPAVGNRVGAGTRAPIPGDVHTVTVSTEHPHTGDLGPRVARVGGEEVSATWLAVGGGSFELSFTTRAGGEEWPWAGVEVVVEVVDGGGLVSVVSSTTVPGSTWGEDSTSRGLSSSVRGLCMGDIDNDNDVDVFAPSPPETLHQLWVNDGSGQFVDGAAAWGLTGDVADDGVGCGFADVDADNDLDVIVAGAGAGNKLYINGLNSGEEVFVEEGTSRGVSGRPNSFAVAWGDVNGDGFVDAFNTANGPADELFINSGAGVFTSEASLRGMSTVGAQSRQAVVVDLTGDGLLDIVTAVVGAPTLLYINTPGGTFSEQGLARGVALQDTYGVSAGDWNNDAALDLLVTTLTGCVLLTNDGFGVFLDSTLDAGLLPHSSPMLAATAVDLEHDGDVDFLVAVSPGNDLALVNARGTLQDASASLLLGIGAASSSLAVGDIDGDGDLDAIFPRTASLFQNHNARPGRPSSVRVRPLTAAGAQSAFGAVVRLACVAACEQTYTGMRVVDGGSGYFSQNGYDAHFGVREVLGRYNGSVSWAGGVHPVATWASHPLLGGVVPGEAPLAPLLVVRPEAVRLHVTVPPWDFAAVSRVGDPSPPAIGDVHTVTIIAEHPAADLTPLSATINQQAALATFTTVSPSIFSLQYSTPPGDTMWPWAGLHVALRMVDSAGLVSALDAFTVPSAAFEERVVTTGLPQNSSSVCAADIDGDGDVDIFTTSDSGNVVLLNDGSGVFTDHTASLGVPTTYSGLGCVVLDANDDGLLDVFVTPQGTAPSLLLVQNPSGSFHSVSAAITTSGSAAAGDLDEDSDVDVFVCTRSGANQVLRNTGGGEFEHDGAVAASTADCRAAVSIDIDNDADLDLIAVNFEAPDLLYVNTGGGLLVERGASRGFAGSGPSVSVAACDVSGDGFVDVVIGVLNAPDLLFVNTGGGAFIEEAIGRGFGSASASTFCFDADHDGDMDIVGAGGATTLWVSTPQGFVDYSSSFGLGGAGPSPVLTASDIDDDGDMDLLLAHQVFFSHSAQPGVGNWVKVRPLTPAGAPAAYGTSVTVACVGGCQAAPWSATQAIHSGCPGTVHFGLPGWGVDFAVTVVFVGGATHSNATDASLGAVTPGGVVDVVNRPYLASVTPVFAAPPPFALGVGDTLSIVMAAGVGRTDLAPGPGCCFVNGVQVVDSFEAGGDGTYTLAYTLAQGDPAWAAGHLEVVPTLRSPSQNLTMAPMTFTLAGAPPGDPVPPAIVLDCRPGAASSHVREELCVSCPGEAACNFTYAVESTTVAWAQSPVPASNYTTPASATFSVGPFADGDTVTLTILAQDGAGNPAPPLGISWQVDTTLPITNFVSTPPPLSTLSNTVVTLQCSEPSCVFAYSLNGGALTPLGGNSTADVGLEVMDTVLLTGPDRVSNLTSPSVSFGVGASHAHMLANASVEVDLEGQRWALAVADNVTQVLPLAGLVDGTYVLHGVAVSGGGVADVTPVRFVFTVDTLPPVATVVRAPPDGEPSASPTIVVGANEAGCTFLWRVGAASVWQPSPSGFIQPVGVDADGVAVDVHVRAVDAAGNVGEPVAVSWMPAPCPPAVPDVAVESSVGAGLGDRLIVFSAVTGAAWASLEYRLDGGPWVAVADGVVLLSGVDLGATHSVDVRAAVPDVCNAALADSRPPPRSVTWLEPAADALSVTLADAPDTVTPDVFATFTLVASRPFAALEYSLNGGQWTPCGPELSVGPLQAGQYTMRVRAVDAAGTGGPEVHHTWTITAFSDSSIVLSGLPDGWHALTVVATDSAGSVEAAPPTFTWRVDTEPPGLVGVRASPRYSTSREAVVDVACTGEVDPCLFCWESDAVGADCTADSPLTLTAPTDGTHEVEVVAFDSVGLVSETAVVVVWTVDSTPPNIIVADVDGVLVPPLYDTGSVDAVMGAALLRLNVTADEPLAGLAATVNDWPLGDGSLLQGPAVALGPLPPIINWVTIAGVDLSGNVGDGYRLHVLVDVTPPLATAFLSPPPLLTAAPSLVVSVRSTDSVGGSGIRHVAAYVDGVEAGLVPGAEGSLTLQGLTTGVYNVSAAGVDVAGNVDPSPIWHVVSVDQDPPASSFVVPPPRYHPSPVITLFVAADEAADVFCRAAGESDWIPADDAGMVAVPGLSDGGHELEIRAVDAAGNVEPPPYTSAHVVVDTAPPELSWTSLPPAYTSEAVAGGCFSVNDSTPVGVTVEPAGAVLPSATCFSLTAASDGGHSVSVTATDAAGNVGGVLVGEWVLDREPPTAVVVSPVSASAACTHVAGGVTVCNTPAAASLQVACSDGGAGVHVSPCQPQVASFLEEAAVSAGCEAPFARRLATGGFQDAPSGSLLLSGGDGDGRYIVVVRAVDAAGNVEEGNTTMAWYLDTVVPVRPALVQRPNDVVSTTTALFVVQLQGDNSPGQTVFWYRYADGVATPVADLPADVSDDVQLELSELANGGHKVEVWAVDQGGNVGPSILHNWQVTTAAPGMVLLLQPAAVSGDATPDFVFAARWGGRPPSNYSEPAAGVEVSLNGAEYRTVCGDTLASGGVCVWNASLADTGVGSYTVNVRANLVGNVGDPTPFSWEYRVCSDREYAVVGADGGISCLECPTGGNCAGGLSTQANIAAVEGWWAPAGSDGLQFYECRRQDACLAGGGVVVGNHTASVVARCADGYTGTLCGVCADGFFEQFSRCRKCDGTAATSALIPVAVSLAMVAAGSTMWKFRTILPRQTIKICFTMTQIIALCSSAYDIPWPPAFADFLAALQIFLMDVLSVTRAQCAQPMSYFESTTVTFVLFKLVLVGVLFGTWLWHAECVRKLRHRMRERSGQRKTALVALEKLSAGRGVHHTPPPPGGVDEASDRVSRRRQGVAVGVLRRQSVEFVSLTSAQLWSPVLRTLFFFLFITYGGITLRVFRMFKCVQVAGDWWLVEDMRLHCYDGKWAGYAVYAMAMGLVFVLGLPAAIAMILVRNRHRLDDPVVMSMWGFLYERYGRHAWLWEVEELGRRLIMTAIPLLLSDGSAFQVAMAVLVSGWAHVLHAVWKPWGAGTAWYYLQHASLLVTSFVFLMGLLFKVDGVTHGSTTYTFLAWVMVLAAAAVVGVCVVYASLECTRGLRARSQAQGSGCPESESTPEAGGAAAPSNPLATPLPTRMAWAAGSVRPPLTLSWHENPLRKGTASPSHVPSG